MRFELYTDAVLRRAVPEADLEPLRKDEVLCARVLAAA